MFSRDQVLALMRERVHHPASMRELLQVLKVAKDDQTSFKRHVKSLVSSGELIQIRGNRFGLPEKMDLYVGRLQTNPAGYGFVTPERPLEPSGGDIYIPNQNLDEAMHGDRVVVRIERIKDGGRAEGRIIRILERANRLAGRPLRPRRQRHGPRRAVRSPRADGRLHPAGTGRRRIAGRNGDRRADALAVRQRAARSATSPRCSATSTRPASTPRSSSASTASPDTHSPEAIAEAVRLGTAVAEKDIRGRTDFRDRADGHHRRRARPRLRRRDHHREAAERQFLARRPHRRRVALRAGGERARSRGLRSRHLRLLS